MAVMVARIGDEAEGDQLERPRSRGGDPARIRPIDRRITRRTSRGMTPTAAMPVPWREAEALGLGPGVADHERGAHGGRREDGTRESARDDGADDDAEVDDRFARRSKTESRNAPSRLTLPVARASAPSNRSKTPPTKHETPPTIQRWRPRRSRRSTVIPKPIRVSAFGRQAEPAEGQGDRLEDRADAGPGLDSVRCVIAPASAQDRALARGDLAEGLGAEACRSSRGRPGGSRRARPRGAAEVPG